jgi:predicted acyltransferase (DUF342 family)
MSGTVTMISNVSVGSDVKITGDTLMSGTLSVNKTVTLASNMSVGSDVKITGNTQMSGTLSVNKTVTLVSNLSVGSDLKVTGNTTVSGTMAVSNTVTLHSNMSVASNVNIVGNTVINSTLSVGGSTVTSGQMIVISSLSVGSIARISNDLLVGSRLSVSGDSYIKSRLVVLSDAEETLRVGGNAGSQAIYFYSGNDIKAAVGFSSGGDAYTTVVSSTRINLTMSAASPDGTSVIGGCIATNNAGTVYMNWNANDNNIQEVDRDTGAWIATHEVTISSSTGAIAQAIGWVYSGGYLYVGGPSYFGSEDLYAVNTSTWTAALVTVPVEKPLLLISGNRLNGNFTNMPNGNIANMGAATLVGSDYHTTIREYSASGSTLTWVADHTLIDSENFPTETLEAGFAIDSSNRVIRFGYTNTSDLKSVYKVYSLSTGEVLATATSTTLNTTINDNSLFTLATWDYEIDRLLLGVHVYDSVVSTQMNTK